MNGHPDLERQVTDWLRLEAPARAPDRILAATLDRVAVLGQERTLAPWRSNDRRPMSRGALIAATAALLAGLLATAVFVGNQLRAEDPPLPVPPPVSVVRTPGQGPVLAWTRLDVIPPPAAGFDQTTTRVAWVVNRFVMVDEDTQIVATSPDGVTWTTMAPDSPDWGYFGVLAFPDSIAVWEDTVVSWTPFAPGPGVRIRQPPDDTFVADFEGTVDAVGIGAAGIVVKTQTEFDQDAFFLRVLGPGWSAETISSIGLQDGVVSLSTQDGETASIDLSEHGVEEWDFANRGEGWFSVDGKDWTPIPVFPANVFSIVGTSDGFLARGDDGSAPFPGGMRMWHSPDGIAWERLAIAYAFTETRSTEPILVPWGGVALQTDGSTLFEAWTEAGKSELPMATELPPGADRPIDVRTVGAGPLGIIKIDGDAGEILFSPDGSQWRIQAMSADMARAGQPGRNAPRMDVAVGTDTVVVLLWEGSVDDGLRPSLWVGAPAP